jgi:hypothetical protein
MKTIILSLFVIFSFSQLLIAGGDDGAPPKKPTKKVKPEYRQRFRPTLPQQEEDTCAESTMVEQHCVRYQTVNVLVYGVRIVSCMNSYGCVQHLPVEGWFVQQVQVPVDHVIRYTERIHPMPRRMRTPYPIHPGVLDYQQFRNLYNQ